MAAAQAYQPHVGADSGDAPVAAATGMGLPQARDISHRYDRRFQCSHRRWIVAHPGMLYWPSASPPLGLLLSDSGRFSATMFLTLLRDDPFQAIGFLLALVVGFTVHEYAHARTAYHLGDLTAYRAGRLTLDPRSHIDPIGALMFLLAGFGWARPVPIDPHWLGRKGTLIVALAGPVSNLVLAALAGLLVRLGMNILPSSDLTAHGLQLLFIFGIYNIFLAVFNMLPVAPLDGWKVLLGLVPSTTAYRLSQFESYGMMILLGVILLGRVGGGSILDSIIGPPVQLLSRLLLPMGS